MVELTQEYLKTILDYDPKTGIFVWVKKPSPKISLASAAGRTNGNGYCQIQIKGKVYYSHRLAFLFMVGRWPNDMIDHINRVENDNRWVNLRECNRSQNYANKEKQINNSSGYKGVCWGKDRKRWISSISINKKRIHVGAFKDKKAAARAYNQKSIELYGEFAYINDLSI